MTNIILEFLQNVVTKSLSIVTISKQLRLIPISMLLIWEIAKMAYKSLKIKSLVETMVMVFIYKIVMVHHQIITWLLITSSLKTGLLIVVKIVYIYIIVITQMFITIRLIIEIRTLRQNQFMLIMVQMFVLRIMSFEQIPVTLFTL